MPPAHDLRRGAAFMVASALLFSLMSVGVKVSAESLPNVVVVFLRSAGGLLFLLPLLDLRDLRTGRIGEHLVRSGAGIASMYCFFYALGHMRLADAVLLNYSLPLFMPFIESAWLDEPFPRRLWVPVLLGFVGIVIVLRPGSGLFQPVALVGLASALFAAIAQVGVRRLTDTEPVRRIVFYFAILASAVSAVPAAAAWQTPRGLRVWVAVTAMGLTATAAQICLTRAYAHAPAAQVGPFIYSSVVFAGLLDWVFWDRLPDAATLLGSVLVGAAGILALRRRPAAQVEPPPEPAGL
jgi:drug/metabolite transporter (DMT)-like permease